MPYFAALTMGLWIAVVVSQPRRPTYTNESAWLVYARLSGAHARLFVFTVIVSLALVMGGILSLVRYSDYDLARMRNPCDEPQLSLHSGEHIWCWRLGTDGTWKRVET